MMTMTDYLAEIDFAARSLFPIIWDERNRLQDLQAQITALTKVVEDNYQRTEFVTQNFEDPDDIAMATGMYWENYFGEDKECSHKNIEREKLVDQIETHKFSVGSLSGSLLQFAKQGISLTHGSTTSCPNGRSIGSQALKDVIWQGRNQASHWEEGNPKPWVQRCFNTLAQEIDSKFADYMKRNMAMDVVELLEWTDFDKFKVDMLSLA